MAKAFGGRAKMAMWRPVIRPRFNIAPTDQHLIVTSGFERRKAHEVGRQRQIIERSTQLVL
jgi:hypothetical protein